MAEPMTTQNPHACSDGGCVLKLRTVPSGMHTNGGCTCVHRHLSMSEMTRLRQGIVWLRERAEPAAGAY